MFFGVNVATGIAVGVGNAGVTGVVVLVANGDVGSGVVFCCLSCCMSWKGWKHDHLSRFILA